MRGPLLGLAVDARTGEVAIATTADSPGTAQIDHQAHLSEPVRAGELIAARDGDTAHPVRWVWWSDQVPRALLAHGIRPGRGLDLLQTDLLLHGGARAAPEHIWARAMGLDPDGVPARHQGDLFDSPDDPPVGSDGPQPLDEQGYLRPGFLAAEGSTASQWAHLAVRVAEQQTQQLQERPRAVATAYSESGAAMLALELERTGLPVHRPTLERLIEASAGPRPHTPQDEIDARAVRDAAVLALIPPGRAVDLRNPEQVLTMLHGLGIRVDNTRKWELDRYRGTHPVVDALLRWRADERIATTYGWAWLRDHVGPDDRLRGRWHSFDGGAGRMTAEAGLHNLPAALRPAVVAAPGHLFVRTDLGQIEPRVLAVVSGDPALIAATAQDDLYRTVADQLRVERPIAKVAALSAMYGGAAGQAAAALEGLDRAYPTAMAYLRAAQATGESGGSITTYGGRLITVPRSTEQAQARARGRFARNAVVQGAAAEFFKAWALTARHAIAAYDARIVLCLHDELLVHVPEEHAPATAAAVDSALQDAARRWTEGSPARFVSDTGIVRSWADAKA
ncbi:DNA polymerase [Allobranchiibius sp. GilTou38]|uniref:DNA polymerase n=1 Tax=Allobranchiibius sp. GilTou38 TaxID=2815210 RepID=UPI001AA14098|nr:DNA polymerase [Allobranchiibius sp. GilTou38]MBO1766967.1 DNA polymerase I [Allobranchiibius sp. GilTou38]